ncbi:CBS domain-containing protein [candidate division KSB1 bacterium]|nr:CBS domain-containing protein [candidate division KSB1 bacterium]
MKVKDVLTTKGSNVVTINQSKTVYDALKTFAENRVGSLLVLDSKEDIVGIIGARDALMAVLYSCDKIREMKVESIMTKDIIVGTPDAELTYVEAIMTNNHIRHLPIVENKKLTGIISIGDVVKAQLKEYHVENHYLKEYIEGKYPA